MAYSKGRFYIGEILERLEEGEDSEDDLSDDEMLVEKANQNIKMKFFIWKKQTQSLVWPSYTDIDTVFGKFVFRNDIVLHESKTGHFHCTPSYEEINKEFTAYSEKYSLK